jgi:hypothetical protein
MGLGRTNKRKGSDAERFYARFFREAGYSFCETSRFVSKKHDNAKIDLMYVPFNIQIKAGIQKNMNPGKELFLMYTAIQMMFPPGDEVFTKPNILFHYKQGVRGKKRVPEDEMVYMSLVQFNLFKEESPELEYTFLKEFKFESISEYKTIVGMTFEVFNNQVITKQYGNVSISS